MCSTQAVKSRVSTPVCEGMASHVGMHACVRACIHGVESDYDEAPESQDQISDASEGQCGSHVCALQSTKAINSSKQILTSINFTSLQTHNVWLTLCFPALQFETITIHLRLDVDKPHGHELTGTSSAIPTTATARWQQLI